MQVTMLINQVNPAKQHVLQEPIKSQLGKMVATMLMQDTMFQQQVNPAKLLA